MSDICQNENRQIDAVLKLNIPQSHIFVDKISGKDFNRPAWKKLVKKLKQGDLLYVTSLDRVGRNYEEIQKWWHVLTKEKGVDIVVIDMPLLDTRKGRDLLGTLIADLVLSLLSYVAHSERDNIKKRQEEGIVAAKNRGVRFGRPVKDLPDGFMDLVEKWKGGEIRTKEILEITGLAATTFYRKLKEVGVVKG